MTPEQTERTIKINDDLLSLLNELSGLDREAVAVGISGGIIYLLTKYTGISLNSYLAAISKFHCKTGLVESIAAKNGGDERE